MLRVRLTVRCIVNVIKHSGCCVSINNTIICRIIIIKPACDVMLVIIALLDPAVCSVDSCMCAHCVFTTEPADAEDQERRRQVSSCGRVRMKAIQRFHIFSFCFCAEGESVRGAVGVLSFLLLVLLMIVLSFQQISRLPLSLSLFRLSPFTKALSTSLFRNL